MTIMPAIELLCQLAGADPSSFSKEENLMIEAELFTRLCEELKEAFRTRYKEYFRVMKFNSAMENDMLETNFLRCIINDILATEEYSIQGIACYTQLPEDVIYDVVAGCNTIPSLPLTRKIIELHRTVRPNLYREIIKKITLDCSKTS